MSANRKRRYVWRWILLLFVSLFLFWYYAPPRVYIFYSKDGTKNISYILNTQHKFVKGDLLPGKTTGDVGHVFPNEDFFMEFYWWRDKERRHCISIAPSWPNIKIHLDRDGNVDMSKQGGTDLKRLKECQWDWSKP